MSKPPLDTATELQKWGIDRGKDPATARWGSARNNDRHLRLADKRRAREAMAERKSAP